MELQDIQERLTAMNEALIGKGFILPDCDMDIEASGNATVWIRTGRDGEIPGKHQYVECGSFEDVLNAADDVIDNFEEATVSKKKEAVRQFGRSIDGLRQAGFEADFTDPLSEQLQVMTDNLLTDQREAV